MSIENGQANVQPKDIAEELLDTIKWVDETKGYCRCPGEQLHTNKTGDRACIVFITGSPTIFCQHQSCTDEVQEATRQLRRAVFDNIPVDPLRKIPTAEIKQKQKEEQRRNRLEIRGRASLSKILKDFRWTYEQIMEDGKDKPNPHPSMHWREIISMFKSDDVIWMGEKWDSGGSEHARNFRTAEEWLKGTGVPGQLTCPGAFKSGAISRSNDNVLHRRFLVVESDVHSKDDVGAIFKWLRDEVGLSLRAVVDTAGKSLHGWFDFPKKLVLEQLEIILPQLGCDAGLFKPSQPCRIPGALRDGKYQALVYLDKATKPRVPTLPDRVLPLPELYYDGVGQCYWRANQTGGWQKINDTSVHTDLISRGYSVLKDEATCLSEVDVTKRQIQLKNDIVYAGPLAGYDAGHHHICNQSILVTQSPVVIEPKQGQWPLINAIIEGLLINGEIDQTPYLFGWIKVAYEAIRDRKLMPGQALAIAGPRESGKSLIQALITEILGGRAAKPYQYMTGGTSFNSEHFGAEHLMIEDESASTDIRARRNLGAAIKNLTVNTVQRCHAKNRTALSLTPFWRLTISVNEEPENLMVMPPIDESIIDKIILLKAHRCVMPMPTNTPREREVFFKALRAELPAFLYDLMRWDIPESLMNARFGVCSYQHPELLEALNDIQPELQLLSILDQSLCFNVLTREWNGTAERLEQELTQQDASFSHKSRKLFYYSNACGSYLGKLAKHFPDRISCRKVRGTTIWTIVKPMEEATGV